VESGIGNIALAIMLLPLLGALIAGLFGKKIGVVATHRVTISLVSVSFLLSLYLVWQVFGENLPAFNGTVYRWMTTGNFQFEIGLLVDRLSALMTCVVLFVSLAVHIYTIGYMAEDPGYERFFSYVSLFTFSMLALVLANNFLLMFFGWEGVGLVSYLLIGFWFGRDSAVAGGLKAFLANRVGDVGFALALAAILLTFGTLDYHSVFSIVSDLADHMASLWPGHDVPAVPLICLLLFIGAMAKSAQVPLHVWLPESMEGPTPISALIHAATMVTAGIYMIARCSPLYEFAPGVRALILLLGATTCFFMGILAIFQNDIKRVIAYSTISQLGYMAAALGVSAYDAAIFHLVTHAFFKALLFLAAGSVIIALHHEQDMRKMGGLATRMPVTCLTFFAGALALSALPPFAGFYSKDAIIEAVRLSAGPFGGYASFCVVAGAFLTPLYIFRALFMTFYGNFRGDAHHPPKESPWVILLPLIVLAIPSVISGALLAGPMLYDTPRLLGDSIFVLPQNDVLQHMAAEYPGAVRAALNAGQSVTLWLVLAGIVAAWFVCSGYSVFSETLKKRFHWLSVIIQHKYGFDDFNEYVLVRGTRALGRFFYRISDLKFIDGIFVNGSGRLVRWMARTSRTMQTGYLYHYALVMVVGLALILVWYSVI